MATKLIAVEMAKLRKKQFEEFDKQLLLHSVSPQIVNFFIVKDG